MNCYRVEFKRDGDESAGFTYVATKEEANKLTKEYPHALCERLIVKMTKSGVIFALNCYASHPDNG